MYSKIKDGSSEVIQGVTCYIPKPGYVFNKFNNLIEYRGISRRATKKSEQYWERQLPPDGYKQKRKEELDRRKVNPTFVDWELQQYRDQEWDRRINGYWFYNNGEPTYITGTHYFYLNYWYISADTNEGYPSYWDIDRKYFYFWEHCVANPECFGMLVVAPRRVGKTAKSTCLLAEPCLRRREFNGGIQSKTDEDADTVVFQGSFMKAFLKLPDFFTPNYDTTRGKKVRNNLKFEARKGNEGESALGGWINYRSGDAVAYDGTKLGRYIGDEVFKTKDIDIRERWNVVKFCLLDPSRKIRGKAILTSTVEQIEGQIEEYMRFWKDSNPEDLDDVGRTKTGLYRFYMPADEIRNTDKFGFAPVADNRERIMMERKAVKDNPSEYNSLVRKDSLTIEEAFRFSTQHCVFDSVKIQDRLSTISWRDDNYETGEFVWSGGDRDTDVEWRPKKNGKWRLRTKGLDLDDIYAGKTKKGDRYYPRNGLRFTMGCDPFEVDNPVDTYKASDGSFYVFYKYDPNNEFYSNSFVLEYISRPPAVDIFFEDVLMTAVFFGTQVLVENDKRGLINYFKHRGYDQFLMRMSGRKDPGLPRRAEVGRRIMEYTNDYIYYNINKVFFPDLLKDWLNYDPSNTTKFDSAMAAGFTLIADNKFVIERGKVVEGKILDASKLFGRKNRVNYE